MISMTEKPITFDVHHPKPLFLVVSGPSGVGKDAAIGKLKERNLPLHVIITVASRGPRPEERDGVDYYFVSREKFEKMIAENAFVEYATVYGDYKGVPREQIEKAFASGKDVIIRVDVQGARRMRTLFPEAVLIFLVPKDEEEWRLRLRNRKTETEESYRQRVETARKEMDDLPLFDYVVVNAHERLDSAVDTIVSIIEAEHHRVVHRQVDL